MAIERRQPPEPRKRSFRFFARGEGERWQNIVIFRYEPDASVETLLRHHRIARGIIYPCMFFGVLWASAMAEFMLVGEFFGPSAITGTIALVSLLITAVLVIPAAFASLWIIDIEKALVERGAPIPGGIPIRERGDRMVKQGLFWFGVLFIGMIVIALLRR